MERRREGLLVVATQIVGEVLDIPLMLLLFFMRPAPKASPRRNRLLFFRRCHLFLVVLQNLLKAGLACLPVCSPRLSECKCSKLFRYLEFA